MQATLGAQMKMFTSKESMCSQAVKLTTGSKRVAMSARTVSMAAGTQTVRGTQRISGTQRIGGTTMSSKKVTSIEVFTKEKIFRTKQTVAKPSPKILSRVQDLRLLSKLEQAGLLSLLEKNGLTLSAIEKSGLLSTAEKFGLISAAADRNTPVALFTLSTVLLAAGPALVYFTPDDNPALLAVQAIGALACIAGGSAAFGGASLLSSLQKLQPHLPASTSRKRCKPPSGVQSNDPYKVLQVAPGSSLVDIKAAYYQKIKLLHPDVNENDTTEQAVVLNAAYATLLQDYSRENGGELQGQPDVFDLPETEATELFVNPFLCYNANPLQWEEIQEVARNAEKEGRDPEEVLRWVRAGPSESAVIYLTPLQLEAVVEELKSIGPAADVITLEACAFYLTDCLYRARVANNRAPLKPR